MKIKNIIMEDFINYRLPCMFIATAICDFKCDKEAGCKVCQNSDLAAAPNIDVSDEYIVQSYIDNDITEAVVIGGMEPFLQFEELYNLINKFRGQTSDPIIIYTGYYPNEVKEEILKLKKFKNIIVKFGRFIPDSAPVYDELLGINLASCNQKAMRLEDC